MAGLVGVLVCGATPPPRAARPPARRERYRATPRLAPAPHWSTDTPCGAVSHAARRADAERHVVPCCAPRDTLHAAQRDARRRSPQMHERAECCKIAQNVATGCAALQHGVLQHGSGCAPGGRGLDHAAQPRDEPGVLGVLVPHCTTRTVKPAQRLTDASTSEGRRNDTVSPAARYGHSEDPLRHGSPRLGYPTTQGIPHRGMVSHGQTRYPMTARYPARRSSHRLLSPRG